MSNSWLRLWHDMPTDPKWRTISRISGQPIALVQSIFIHLLVDASRNVTRGHITVTNEDLASALDVTDDAIKAVIDAMQGRVLDGDSLTGWSGRQPKREDLGSDETGAKSAAQRKREQRKRERDNEDEEQCHEMSRNVTTDKDKDKDKETPTSPDGFADFWSAYPKKVGKGDAEKAWKKARINGELQIVLGAIAAQKKSDGWTRDRGQYIPNPATWLNRKQWLDEVGNQASTGASNDWI